MSKVSSGLRRNTTSITDLTINPWHLDGFSGMSGVFLS